MYEQNMHNLWYAIKRPNPGIVGTEELYIKRRENIFIAIIPENSPNPNAKGLQNNK